MAAAHTKCSSLHAARTLTPVSMHSSNFYIAHSHFPHTQSHIHIQGYSHHTSSLDPELVRAIALHVNSATRRRQRTMTTRVTPFPYIYLTANGHVRSSLTLIATTKISYLFLLLLFFNVCVSECCLVNFNQNSDVDRCLPLRTVCARACIGFRK